MNQSQSSNGTYCSHAQQQTTSSTTSSSCNTQTSSSCNSRQPHDETMSMLSPECQVTLRTLPLGPSIKCCFNLDRSISFLNHGSFGTTGTPVLAAQAYYVNLMETNPERFIKKSRKEFLKRTRKEIATFVGADVDDIVLVPNATTGVNAVLQSMDLTTDDEVLCLNLACTLY